MVKLTPEQRRKFVREAKEFSTFQWRGERWLYEGASLAAKKQTVRRAMVAYGATQPLRLSEQFHDE
jgi:hypothetical protein